MPMQQLYHGWLIQLTSESTGYSFQCCFPDGQITIDDGRTYSTPQQALTVARNRADLETAGLALIRFFNEIYGHCYYLTSDDHIALTSSILECLRS
jgi:hypothetical protein